MLEQAAMIDGHVRDWVEAQCKLVLFAVINALGPAIPEGTDIADPSDRGWDSRRYASVLSELQVAGRPSLRKP